MQITDGLPLDDRLGATDVIAYVEMSPLDRDAKFLQHQWNVRAPLPNVNRHDRHDTSVATNASRYCDGRVTHRPN